MRFGGLIVSIAVATIILLAAGPPALQAQTGDPIRLAEATKKKKAAPGKDAKKKAEKGAAKSQPTPGAYAGMPIAARAAIQFDLNWTHHYTGPADGEFNDRSVNA